MKHVAGGWQRHAKCRTVTVMLAGSESLSTSSVFLVIQKGLVLCSLMTVQPIRALQAILLMDNSQEEKKSHERQIMTEKLPQNMVKSSDGINNATGCCWLT